LTATLTQVLEDAVEELGIRYIQEFESLDDETNEFLKKRALKPNYDEKEKERLAKMLNKMVRAK
jgi:TRAP-type C4-dicarboxylate transport system substrate-binding protein